MGQDVVLPLQSENRRKTWLNSVPELGNSFNRPVQGVFGHGVFGVGVL